MIIFKLLIGLPITVALLVFAFVNNNMVELSLWPTEIEITISQSVLIVLLYALGYLVGWFFTWLSYSSIRSALRNQKKQNRKIAKEQEKLTKEVEGLRGNIDVLKASIPPEEVFTWWQKFKKIFHSDSKLSKEDEPR